MRTLAAAALGLACLLAAPAAGSQDLVRRGEYLAQIMDCQGCHTSGAMAGMPDPKLHLAGSPLGFGIPDLGIFYPPNLTPDAETGLGSWTEADIVRAVRTGIRPDGRQLAPAMPWRSYAALTDGDAEALAAYLKSLAPVSHKVPPPTGTKDKPPAPFLGLVVPQ
ncbi:c-type cytochrome [Arenibaculum pallidiluteum]|uniref:c-type cytochrome n=1 Tax=Arenibaculum pallidiluteum TaxID=2812559 RepID=UPI001A97123F|nr:cytochrome c [Arenibaculum pallidiluteum]